MLDLQCNIYLQSPQRCIQTSRNAMLRVVSEDPDPNLVYILAEHEISYLHCDCIEHKKGTDKYYLPKSGCRLKLLYCTLSNATPLCPGVAH